MVKRYRPECRRQLLRDRLGLLKARESRLMNALITLDETADVTDYEAQELILDTHAELTRIAAQIIRVIGLMSQAEDTARRPKSRA